MQKLILWDIDGTLLSTGGVAAAAMREALAQTFGSAPSEERVSYAGKTDLQILVESLPHLSVEAVQQRFDRFATVYLGLLVDRQADLMARSRVMPGVIELLRQLRGRSFQGLLTGNIATVARHKLHILGLLEYLDLEAGAFGGDHHTRPALLPIAAARAAQRYGRPFTGSDMVIVGDTPNDILCGRSGGARTVAVATGAFSLDDLRAYQPDVLLPNLADPRALEAIVGQ